MSLDWVGVVVKRLHGNISLDDYMIENIWKKVGLSAPFPTFCISRDEAYRSRLMSAAERGSDDHLKPYKFWQGDNPVDQDGGHGLSGTAKDGLVGRTKTAEPQNRAMMFEPQIRNDSPAMPMLLRMRPAWELVAGAVLDNAVNHGLGGFLVTEDVPHLGQLKNMLAWGGAANTVWFASRARGVAGFFSTQLHPFSDPAVKDLVNAWKRDFWDEFDVKDVSASTAMVAMTVGVQVP